MYPDSYHAFLRSGDTLRIYRDGKLVFSSRKDRLLPLMEYIGQAAASPPPVVIFDKVTGNAAALLSVKAGGTEVFSPMGSQPGADTLDRYGVKHRLAQIVPRIMKADSSAMCPMEELSLGKSPEDFYQAMRKIIYG